MMEASLFQKIGRQKRNTSHHFQKKLLVFLSLVQPLEQNRKCASSFVMMIHPNMYSLKIRLKIQEVIYTKYDI